MVEWEGHPLSFALRYPYLVAFDTTFIEVRHVETVCALSLPDAFHQRAFCRLDKTNLFRFS